MPAATDRLSHDARIGARTILAAGAVVGVLDGIAAVLFRLALRGDFAPVAVFQGIAAVPLGKGALAGGGATALLGLAMHFLVATIWAGCYAIVYRHWPALRRTTRTAGGAIGAGLLFGPFVWLTMRLIVLPLLGVHSPIVLRIFLAMVGIHMTCVGPPIALIVRDRRAGESLGQSR